MTSEAPANLTSRPYRGLSVQEVDVELTEHALLTWILGRDVYRRTEFLLACRAGRAALLSLEHAVGDDLFVPVTGARVLALPEQVMMLESPETDVGNATALADAVGPHRQAGTTIYVVTGRYQHMNFICNPSPVTLYVDEVVPPHPAKLIDMVRQAIQFDEDLPPVNVISRIVSLPMLMRTRASEEYLLPCRGAGTAERHLRYLDAGPSFSEEWTVVGCERSKQIYEHHYGEPPSRTLDFCPAVIGDAGPSGLRVTKCCQLERGTELAGGVATVPWGANLDEVRSAIVSLVMP